MAKSTTTNKDSNVPVKKTASKKSAGLNKKSRSAATQIVPPDSAIHSRLAQFFATSLQELYWSELHLVNVLNSMAEAATTQELKESFNMHMQQTRTHVSRLEEVFNMLSMPQQESKCVGLQGLFDEGWRVIDETEEGSAQRDVALIIAAQKVEHYEMACYGSMVTLARTLGRNDVAELLTETLVEEKETDAILTQIAEGKINMQASREPV